jgi:(S)-2-hydroxyglutarate dehydrogenase
VRGSVRRFESKCDVLIIGAGVVGLASGIALLEKHPKIKVVVAEKENRVALHASGRNSGVLHAGFYYSPDSLKAKFCRDGNSELRVLAKKYNIPIRDVGKVVVTRNDSELPQLEKLYQRGIANGVDLEVHGAKELQKFEPLAVTKEKFLWSPTTGVADSKAIVSAMYKEFIYLGGKVDFNRRIELEFANSEIFDSSYAYDAKHIINAAGAQADRISRSVGVGSEYAMLPFMGIYRATKETNLPLKTLVYPIPHSVNPFLGVHFTLTFDHKVKIGPTAIPIAGREQYSLKTGWSMPDIFQAMKGVTSLVKGESHDFKAILRTEWPKVIQSMLVKESAELIPTVGKVKEWSKMPPGIRAQLVHLPTGKLEQDFVVKSRANSIHVLNAVSPGWTSALPFARFIIESLDY